MRLIESFLTKNPLLYCRENDYSEEYLYAYPVDVRSRGTGPLIPNNAFEGACVHGFIDGKSMELVYQTPPWNPGMVL